MRLAVAVALAALLASRPVGAQGVAPETGPMLLARAQRALDDLRYEEAASLLDRAWRAGGSRPAELVRLFELTGTVAFTLGRGADADTAFQRLAALAPEHRLPDGTSPKIIARLDAARAALNGRALAVEVAARAAVSGAAASDAPAISPVISIDVRADPAHLVGSARAIHRDPGRRIRRCQPAAPTVVDPATGAATFAITCPRDVVGVVEVDVVDAHGNALVERRVRVGPLPEATDVAPSRAPPGPAEAARRSSPLSPAPDAADRSTPLHARGLPWAIATVGLGGAGVFFGLRSESAQDDLDELNRTSADHDFRDALAVEDRLRRDSRIANTAFVAAGATSVVAAILWIREWRRRPSFDRAPVAAARSPLTWTFEF